MDPGLSDRGDQTRQGRERPAADQGRHALVAVYDRYALKPGTRLAGPVVLEERESTLVVPVPATVRILPDYTVSIAMRAFQ